MRSVFWWRRKPIRWRNGTANRTEATVSAATVAVRRARSTVWDALLDRIVRHDVARHIMAGESVGHHDVRRRVTRLAVRTGISRCFGRIQRRPSTARDTERCSAHQRRGPRAPTTLDEPRRRLVAHGAAERAVLFDGAN